MARLIVLAAVLAACGVGHQTPRLDASLPHIDAPPPDAPLVPYRHTITVDGVDDFTAGEAFATTSASYGARITWDDQTLFVGYGGADLAPGTTDASTKWLFVYLDTAAGGATDSEMYNTQHAVFPAGFAADYYARYKCDGTFATLQHYDAGAWSTAAPAPATAQAGTFVELAIPLSSIGAGQTVGIVTWMINEKALAEGSYAGLYADNFVDGYSAALPLTAYLHADFTSSRAPDDPANRAP